METAFVLLPVAVTSLVAYRMAGIDRGKEASLRPAIRMLLEFVGVFVLFFVLNIAAGAAIILLIRGLTPRFVPLYRLVDVLVAVFSAAQAFLFQHWMDSCRQRFD